jgi:hypothetical protein
MREFLKTPFLRQDALIRRRQAQFRDLLQCYGLDSSDLKFFRRVKGDSLCANCKSKKR